MNAEELPPGAYMVEDEYWFAGFGFDYLDEAWEYFKSVTGITRERYTTMRAAAEELDEAWRECAKLSEIDGAEVYPLRGGPLWEAVEVIRLQLRAAVEQCALLEIEVGSWKAEELRTRLYWQGEMAKAEAELAALWARVNSGAYETLLADNMDLEEKLASMTAERDETTRLHKLTSEEVYSTLITLGEMEAKLAAAITERNALEADISKTDQAAEKLLEQRDEARGIAYMITCAPECTWFKPDALPWAPQPSEAWRQAGQRYAPREAE